MGQDAEKSSNSIHVNEFRERDSDFDSVSNVIRRSNLDPYKILLKRIIGELPIRDPNFDSTEKFKKYLAAICDKEINGASINFNFDLLSKYCKEIINPDYGSINFDKAGLLIESSAKVYSSKVDHLYSLVSQAAENVRKRNQPEKQKIVPELTEEYDFWVPDEIEVDPNRDLTLDEATTPLINLAKPPADLVLEDDSFGDGESLESYSLAKCVLYRDFLLLDPHDTAAVDEYLKGEVDARKGQHSDHGSSSRPSKSFDGRCPADGGYSVPQNVLEDDSAYCQGDSYGYESPVRDAKIEEYLHPFLESSLNNIDESEKLTEMAARVSLWKQQIEQDLEEQEARSAFDVNDYSEKVLHKLSQSADLENKVSFADAVRGEEKHHVAQNFSAILQLANNGAVDLQRSENDDEEFVSANSFSVQLLRPGKRRQQLQFQPSKRRAVSESTEGESKDVIGSSGKENHEP
ncbi:condensin-2 complex subunit H2-like [Apium graveolens]|uniref:condensin-2 complex subunit H2-like n=1 Tax=Apium graveolens TaxID=4045 RepID=UPI003D7AC046